MDFTKLDKFYDKAKDESFKAESLAAELVDNERYTDFERIGVGGMKNVYKVFDSRSKRHLAYARLKDNHSEEQANFFIREARLTAQLEHPNIISVYDVGLDKSDSPYFTMELKVGKTLEDVLKNTETTLNSLLQTFIKICDALAYAHSKKIIHLDLKPENVQIGRYGEVMVCDWGLSKVLGDQDDPSTQEIEKLNPDLFNSMTMHGHIRGTPGYMSPEQISGDDKTESSDIYSLGCILYTILCRKAPLSGELETVLGKTLKGAILPPSQVKHEVPDSLNAVVMKAISVNQNERYSSVEELKKEVQNFLDGYATEAESASSGKLISLFIKRNKVLSFVLLTAVIVIIAIVSFSFTQIKERERIAVQNLKMFKEQKKKTDAANKQFYKEMVSARQQIFRLQFNQDADLSITKSISQLKGIQKLYPDVQEVNASLGYLHFVKQDFNASLSFLGKFPGKYAYMIPYAQKYGKIKGSESFLKINDFISLLNEVEPLKALHYKMLYYYASHIKDTDKNALLVKTMVKKFNPDWDESLYMYDDTNKKLSIGGEGLQKLAQIHNPLLILPIKNLEIRSKDLSTLGDLEDLNLVQINLRYTAVRNIREIKKLNLKTLEKLYLGSNQIPDKKLNQLPDNIMVKSSGKNN